MPAETTAGRAQCANQISSPKSRPRAEVFCIDADGGWLYLAGMKDVAKRDIFGGLIEDHMWAELCCDALAMALGCRGPVPGRIHHSEGEAYSVAFDD